MAKSELIHCSPTSKISLADAGSRNKDSILYWAALYWNERVAGSPKGTQQANKNDLQLFLGFFSTAVGGDQLNYWTPSVYRPSKHGSKRRIPKATLGAFASLRSHFR